jgi:hypothetical protein
MRKRLPKSACVALYLLSIFLDLMTSNSSMYYTSVIICICIALLYITYLN